MNKYTLEIKWGVIFSVMTLAWMAFEKSMGWHDVNIEMHPIYTNFVAIPSILIYVFALLEIRKKIYGNVISYKQSFMAGLIITLVVTIISPINQLIISGLITPDYFTNAIKYSVENNLMTESDASSYFSTSSYVMQALIGAPIMGILTSVIVSIFVKRKGD